MPLFPEYPDWVGDFNDTTLAYLAGLIDGEGSVDLHIRTYPDRPASSFGLRVEFSNTDPVLREWADQLPIGRYYRRNRAKGHYKELWTWWVSNRTAIHLLGLLLPYLTVKRKKAEIVLRLWERIPENGPRKTISTEERAARMAIYQEYRDVS